MNMVCSVCGVVIAKKVRLTWVDARIPIDQRVREESEMFRCKSCTEEFKLACLEKDVYVITRSGY